MLLLVGLMTARGAFAQEDEGDKKSGFVVRAFAYDVLSSAHKLINENKYQDALTVMGRLTRRRDLNDHEQALMYQTIGYTYAAMEKYKDATINLEKCLSFNALPDATTVTTMYNLGQLYVANRQFQKAVVILRRWLDRAQNPTPNALFTVAVAYSQAGDKRAAVRYAERAIAGSKKTPPESWLQLVLSLHFDLKNHDAASKVLKQLVTRRPEKKSYWLQLSAMYSELKQDEMALAVLELAHRRGLLTEPSEIRSLAERLMYQGVPVKAAQLLERAVAKKVLAPDTETLTLIANAYLSSRELDKAVKPLSTAAGKSSTGEAYARLAQVHIQMERWTEATKALKQALAKGNLKNPGQIHLLLGIVHYNRRQLKDAQGAFERARGFEASQRSAERWLKYLAEPGSKDAAPTGVEDQLPPEKDEAQPSP